MTNQSTLMQRKIASETTLSTTSRKPDMPPDVGPGLLLESVAAITHMRDSDALDRSLVLSLAELTHADCVQLHRHRSPGSSKAASVVQCTCQANGTLSVSVRVSDSDVPHDVDQERHLVSYPLADGRQRISVPVFNDSRLQATLLVDNALDPDSAQQLVSGFARIYANYIALLNESERDKLTGLYNRRTFERHLQKRLNPPPEDQETAAEAAHVWVAIADIDHFKRVNDTFGHLYGDEVILLIAQRMRHSFGEKAHLFRFGGEEFVVLFNADGETQAQTMLEHFRRAVADRTFPQVGAVSVSMGFCHITKTDFPEAALDRADQALYYAKSHGRNQLHGYEQLIRNGDLKTVSSGSIDLF